jgi:hypothetical protein
MDVFMSPNEEQFRQAISRLDLPKAQMEAICDLHSAIYEAIDWKGIYDKLSHLDDYPKVSKAIKLGAAGLIASSPIHGIYVTDWDEMGKRFGGGDKAVEQYVDLPERDFLEREPVMAYDDSLAQHAYELDANPYSIQGNLDKKAALEKEKENRSLVRDELKVDYPKVSTTESIDTSLRNFMKKNLSYAYKKKHTPEEQDAHIDRILKAVKDVAAITAPRGIGEGELLALICVESMFDDKPKTTKYRGLAQLGPDAMADAKKHAAEFGLNSANMADPENVENAVNLAAGYLLYLMYDSARSNMVNEGEKDDSLHGDMRFVFACYNGGIGKSTDQYHDNETTSVPKLYRRVLHGDMTANDAVRVRGNMSEALSYPSKIFQVLDYLKSIGVPTRFDSRNYIYRKR